MLRPDGGHRFGQGGPVELASLEKLRQREADILHPLREEQAEHREFGAVGIPHAPAAVECTAGGFSNLAVACAVLPAEGGIERTQAYAVETGVEKGALLLAAAFYIHLAQDAVPGGGSTFHQVIEASSGHRIQLRLCAGAIYGRETYADLNAADIVCEAEHRAGRRRTLYCKRPAGMKVEKQLVCAKVADG